MSKFLGFLLGIAVALVGPAMFGVLAADGGIKLNAKEMALAYGIGALIFWTVLSYFSGAAALGAALTFGAMIYTVHWIPNRTTNFLNDVPGVTTGMIDGIKQYTLNGVVPILAVISLIFGIQLIVQAVQRRRRQRAEAERLQREQDAAQQQEIESTAVYPVAAGDYQPDSRFGNNFGNSSYDDLFEDEPEPVQPRNQADEQTTQFAESSVGDADADEDEDEAADRDETVLVSTDRDETVLVPAESEDDEVTVAGRTDLPQAPPPQPAAVGTAGESSEVDETVEESTAAPKPAEPQAPQAAPPASQGGSAGTGAGAGAGGAAAGGAVPGGSAGGGSTAGGAVAGGAEESGTRADKPKPQQPPTAPQAQASQGGSLGVATGGAVAGGSTAGVTAASDAVGGGAVVGGAVAGGATDGRAAQAQAPQAQAPQAARAPQPQAPVVAAPVPVETQVAPVVPDAGRPAASFKMEEVGQQYRERMDPPHVDDTGEFHLGAFETASEHTQPMMDLPGRFRTT